MSQRYLVGWLAAILVCAVAMIPPSAAQSFEGRFLADVPGETVWLDLAEDDSGNISGTLSGQDATYQIRAELAESEMAGTVAGPYGPPLSCTGRFDETGRLVLSLYPRDSFGQPVYQMMQNIIFQRQSEEQQSITKPANELEETAMVVDESRSVTINRVTLTAEELASIEERYQTQVPDGKYWYDADCGAWGIEGGPTAGFLPPGLELPGPMPADISGGGTGIFINGREIHVQDQLALYQLFGVTYPGRFWLDAAGSLGPEGGPPIANLAVAMQQAAGRKSGTTTGIGGTVGFDESGGAMFSGRNAATGKSIFWYKGR